MDDRVQALIFLWEHHSKGAIDIRMLADRIVEGKAEAIEIADRHQKYADKAFRTIIAIAHPQPEEKEANPKKFPSHRPSCPTDAPDPLHDIDPKQYW